VSRSQSDAARRSSSRSVVGFSIVLALAAFAPGCSSNSVNLTPGTAPSAKPTATPSAKPTATPSAKPTATPKPTPSPDANYKVLYKFDANDYAVAGVTAFNDSLYVSFAAGGRSLAPPSGGPGGVYELSASGAARVLNADGAPYSDVTPVNGVLYGTGNDNDGNIGVFSLTLAGSRNLFFALTPTADYPPVGDLLYVNGKLYGSSTSHLMDCNCAWGNEYEVSPSGAGSILYQFQTWPADGEFPQSGLVYENGKFYGTTSCHDDYFASYYYCPGTVFSMSPAGKEATLYRFKGGSDGIHPFASLVYLHGLLYGTTQGGGSGDNGTVFAMSPAGAENVVYRFKNVPDGSEPIANLTVVGDVLYGTTVNGGANGLGSIFRVTTAGVESVVHSFRAADGTQPISSLTYHGGKLYGTTTAGGENGTGTVFEEEP